MYAFPICNLPRDGLAPIPDSVYSFKRVDERYGKLFLLEDIPEEYEEATLKGAKLSSLRQSKEAAQRTAGESAGPWEKVAYTGDGKYT